MDYREKHSSALMKVRDYGSRVYFRWEEDTYNESTDAFSDVSPRVVIGYAVELPEDPSELNDLVKREPVTLFFVPDRLNTLPPLNSTVMWAGTRYTLKNITPIRPAGEVIAATMVLV